MKLYCRNSGISFDVQYGGFIKEASYVHPIFHMPVSQLLKQRGAWFTGRIENEMDKRLLFLSLLNSSELIEFSHPAEPSAKTVAVNMPRLFDLVDWMVRLRSPFIVLPSYRVSGDNRSLDNIRYWLDSWQAERIRFEDGYRKWDKDKIQADRENALERSIKNPTKRSEQYARLLSRWAFDASDAPINKRELWTSIFLLRTPAIYSYNTNLIQAHLK